MANPGETAALVALLRDGARPWSVYTELVEDAGSARAVLELERFGTPNSADRPRLFEQGDAPFDSLDAIADEIDRWKDAGAELVTILDRGYPENLRAAHDRPPLVCEASTTTVAREKPDMTALRIGKLRLLGGASGQNCEMIACSRASWRCSSAFWGG